MKCIWVIQKNRLQKVFFVQFGKKTVLSSKKTVLEEKEKHYRKQKQKNNGHTKNISKLNLGRAVEL